MTSSWMAPRRARHPVIALLAVTAVLSLVAPAAFAKPPQGGSAQSNAQTTEIQILALNDFHGNLRPPDASSSGGRIGPALSSGGIAAGGVEYLATHVRDLRATNPNTMFVSAGDLIGASPLISAAFHDEPTIEAFNLMGLDYNGVGNHEFDEGVPELLRMQTGGCHPVDGCQDGDGFSGADFDFLAANVTYESTGDTIFPPYAIHHFPGVKVAVIGMTLEGTPSVVTASAVQGIDFADEANTVNALVPHLKAQGIETIVVLLHEGGSTSIASNGAGSTNVNQCVNTTGAIPPIVNAMDDEVDVVITGHTNWAVNCVMDGKIVTGAASFGRLVTDIDLTVSRATKDVVGAVVNNVIVTRTVPPAADLTTLVNKYGTLVAPIENQVIGNATAALTRASTNPPTGNGESVLGDIIADAQLWATAGVSYPGGPAVVSFMNPGGIRADINAGAITYGEAFSVQPFGNILVTMDMTGAQIDAVLEQQTNTTTLQIPASLTYDRSTGSPAGSRISNIRINGTPIVPGNTYRVTVNNFLADGGDGFTTFALATNRYFGQIDLDALAAYLTFQVNTSPTAKNRITMTP